LFLDDPDSFEEELLSDALEELELGVEGDPLLGGGTLDLRA